MCCKSDKAVSNQGSAVSEPWPFTGRAPLPGKPLRAYGVWGRPLPGTPLTGKALLDGEGASRAYGESAYGPLLGRPVTERAPYGKSPHRERPLRGRPPQQTGCRTPPANGLSFCGIGFATK